MRIEAGLVGINQVMMAAADAPFGGVKEAATAPRTAGGRAGLPRHQDDPPVVSGAPHRRDAALEAGLALRFEHAFDIRINFDKRWIFGPISGGAHHGYTSVGQRVHGEGPAAERSARGLQRRGLARRATDGVVELNAHYMIEADDGARIYIRNQGYVHGPLRKPGRRPDEPPAIPAYFRCTPYFRAPGGAARLAESLGRRRYRAAPPAELTRRRARSLAVPLLPDHLTTPNLKASRRVSATAPLRLARCVRRES